jgi:hypothetical protein
MRYLITTTIIVFAGIMLYSQNNKYYDRYVKEFQDIVFKKDAKRLIEHLSADGIDLVATSNPEKWSKKQVAEYLSSKEPNEVKEFFFKVLPEEFNDRNIDVNENSAKDGCDLDSNLRGSGIQVYIKKKGDSWVITGFGYI